MRTVALGEVVDFYSGGTPSKRESKFWDGDVPWFSAKHMKSLRLAESDNHVTDEVFRETSLRKIPAGTVVLVVRGMILAHTVPVATLDVDAAINQDLKALLPREDIDPSYLSAVLRAQHEAILKQVGTAAHGTKKLESRVLENIRIPLPAPSEQRRIAGILDQADAVRVKRRQVLGHLDVLTQSIFHDMFGVVGGERWDTAFFNEIVRHIDSGASPKCETRAAENGEWGVLKLGAVTYGVFRQEENKAYLDEIGSMAANEVTSGDVLMTRKNTRDLVGAVAIADETRPRLLLPDLIFRLHLDRSRVNPWYFQALMMNPRKRHMVRDLASGSAASMPNISKARLSKLPIELPPLDLQREFAARVKQINAQRAVVQRALDADNGLFASLQARAFRGEL
ncbi:restriction endonuclease subunit S [Prauserella cavernicola]|uniref:Restriction endonuclease subunit S n=1 Tax=Prauserella cavernicola TaxID=2800127 RepID=A0A934QQU9_9PSEU|nr:restriction endonuclease subunit S [Prauserella cavernicola]MBK1784456.1 restriction endonuclease subunit S [Prauserella cavernicola]